MLNKIKQIREKTGCGIMDIKKALDEAKGNEKKAIELLRKKGQATASKKSSRETKEGLIQAYVHSNGKVASLVKLYCETDFVAKNKEFQELAKDISMHIVAMNPLYLEPENIPKKVVEKEKEIWTQQLKDEGKKKGIIPKILEGKEKKFREENALLTQPFVKNPDITVKNLIIEKIAKIGENIQIGDFLRYEL